MKSEEISERSAAPIWKTHQEDLDLEFEISAESEVEEEDFYEKCNLQVEKICGRKKIVENVENILPLRGKRNRR